MQKKFLIENMTCASCVAVNTKSLNALDWVTNVAINLATKQATIEYDENKISFEDIKKEIISNWFEVNEETKLNQTEKKDNKIFYRFLLSLIFSIPVFGMMFWDFMIGKSLFWVDLMMYIYAILSFVVVVIFWWQFHKNAFKSLLKLHFNMDSLISLGTLTALIYSIIAMFIDWLFVYFEAAVAITTLINLWKYLESKAKKKAWDAIWKLLELWAKKALVKEWDKLIEKDIDDIKIWEIIIVKAWEKIALDWEVIQGTANVEESMLTGESMPVFKQIWDECYGGTINLDWNISIKVTKENKNWTLANIIKLIDQAQSSKAPIERLADKISGIFVPTIIIISILTFIIWYFISWDISKAIITSVSALIIACPCALWLATPTAIMVGTWIWAKNWILIKEAQTLEKTKDIDVVVFDKTWTLTNAKPELTDIIWLTKTKEELLKIAKSLSSLSHHPLSKAITNYEFSTTIFSVDNFEEIRWKWTFGKINWEEIKLWNKKLFQNISSDILNQINELTKNWKTPIIIWNDKEIFWIIWLIDLPKEWVQNTIQELHSMGIELVMLTWDTKNTAEYIAKQIKIDKVIAEVLPEDKLNIIKDLQKDNKKVAFVWDWINDAPALVQADLSIAMWTGSDIAIESSNIVLVKWNLEKVVSAINLSRQTLRIIKQNLFWAFIYNIIWIPLAIFGVLNPIFASFAMSMSSVCVVSNSLRLRFFKK